MEIAGLFNDVDIVQIETIIKSIILCIKTMKYYSINESTEVPICLCTINDGKIIFNSMTGHDITSFNLASFKPKQ